MGIDYTKRPGRDDEPPVNLSKVTLTKAAPTVSLSKQGSAGGTLRVNLNWNAQPGGRPTGLFKKASSGAIDLDLGCLYEYADGSKGAVQALGKAFRDRHTFGAEPICWLDGDDRSGSNSGGENLYVDLGHLKDIKRILVFALIYEGVPNWSAADGVVTLIPASGPQVEVRLDEANPRARMCAIAMLENTGGELSVRREVRYAGGHQELDKAFGWGMRWAAGRK